ncbi:MAG: NADH:ubiquinone oxidoreductase subunit NDUFA12 [Alphaproteobacteria bacterium]
MSWGTHLFTWIYGRQVGTDRFGNRYYESRHFKRYGRGRRWVLYRGGDEASKVPPEWHAWLHNITDEPLQEAAAAKRPWQKEHLPNLTGSPEAYRPEGHVLNKGAHASATGDYEPWRPS